MIEVGRLCVKTAGRDARLKCVVVDVMDKGYVLIDGQTRRRKCNIAHLEPLETIVKIKKNATHAEVVKALKDLNIVVKERKPKPKTERPKRVRKVRKKEEEEKPKEKKKEKKKEDKKPAEKVKEAKG